MSEILTESFCERCGTRYTFESPARRSSPLGALGTVGRGLRNFVAQPDQSIDEAFAVARAETEQRATAHQLEAFHRTFNFCLSCRQYTCGECWNPIEGRCQSCAPMPELEAPAAAVAAPEALTAAESVEDAAVVYEAIAIARAAATPVVEPPEAETLEAPEAPEDVLAEPDLEVAVEPEPMPEQELEPEAEAIVEIEPAAEPELEIEPAPLVEAEPAPEPLIGAQPEFLAAAEPVIDAEPVAEPEPATKQSLPSAPAPLFAPGVSLDEEIAAYDLRMAALAVPPPTLTPAPPPAIQPIAASSAPVAPAPAPRMMAAVVPDLPAASAAALPSAQAATSCPSCALALSATARFCRRCGMAQQH